VANFTANRRDKRTREKELKDGVSMSETAKTQIGRAFGLDHRLELVLWLKLQKQA
jgi:hypothetical protein